MSYKTILVQSGRQRMSARAYSHRDQTGANIWCASGEAGDGWHDCDVEQLPTFYENSGQLALSTVYAAKPDCKSERVTSLVCCACQLSKTEVLFMPEPSDPIGAASSAQVDLGSVPTFVARGEHARWFDIDAVLSPIIGGRSMMGLYKRSLSLTRSAHPLLSVVYYGPLVVGDYTTLRQLLAVQPAAIAMATNEALLKTFNDLLGTLVGSSLTERLLSPALDNVSTIGAAAAHFSQ